MKRLVFITLIASFLIACSSKSILMSPTASLTRGGGDMDNKDSQNINLKIQVTEFSPGNAGLRMTVGLGAGRGSLVYLAEYTSQEGKTLAKMNGEERFTGAEIGFNQNYGGFTTMGGEETATRVLIKEAAKHIVELALNPEQQ